MIRVRRPNAMRLPTMLISESMINASEILKHVVIKCYFRKLFSKLVPTSPAKVVFLKNRG